MSLNLVQEFETIFLIIETEIQPHMYILLDRDALQLCCSNNFGLKLCCLRLALGTDVERCKLDVLVESHTGVSAIYVVTLFSSLDSVARRSRDVFGKFHRSEKRCFFQRSRKLLDGETNKMPSCTPLHTQDVRSRWEESAPSEGKFWVCPCSERNPGSVPWNIAYEEAYLFERNRYFEHDSD